MLGMFIAMHPSRRSGFAGGSSPLVQHGVHPHSRIVHQPRKKGGAAVKRKLASVLVSLLFEWLTTTAIADEDTKSASPDSSAAMSETAAPEQPTDTTSTADPVTDSTSDGSVAASPAETDSK
jgi:hypothetical protein